MTGETEERSGNEDHGQRDEIDVGLLRYQHVHRQRAEAEIDDADPDLQ